MENEAQRQPVVNAPPSFSDSRYAVPAWDEAFLRVEGYLRAYGMESPVLLNQAAAAIIREAQERAEGDSIQTPVALAMEVTHSRIGAWFAKSGGSIDWADERMRSQGRLALIIADLPGRWANCFLSADPLPPDLAALMASPEILPGPEMRVSNMAPEPLEFSLLDPGDPRLRSRRIWFPVRAAVSWLLISGLFGVAWAATH